MHDVPLFIQLIGIILTFAAAGAVLSITIMVIAFILWLASIPLKLVGILPGIWWSTT